MSPVESINITFIKFSPVIYEIIALKNLIFSYIYIYYSYKNIYGI